MTTADAVGRLSGSAPGAQLVADLGEELGVGVERVRVGLCRVETLLRRLVRGDDEEVDDQRHDDEGDQSREERPDGVEPTRPPVVEARCATCLGQDLDDHLGERRDDGGERQADDEGDGQLDEVSAQDEVLKSLHMSSFSGVVGWCGGRVVPRSGGAAVGWCGDRWSGALVIGCGSDRWSGPSPGRRLRAVSVVGTCSAHRAEATRVTTTGPSREPWPATTASASWTSSARTTPRPTGGATDRRAPSSTRGAGAA